MLYFDTSFLAPLFKQEARSADVERFMDDRLPGAPTISDWSQVEFCSLLARDVRIGTMTPGQADEADAAFDAFSAQTCATLDVARRDFYLARQYLSAHRAGLRAGDAPHLATAANAGAIAVYSLDRALLATGLMVGVPMNVGFPVAAS